MGKVKPTLNMDLGRHARKAAAIMQERGHATGALETHDGRVCLLGAMYRATSPIENRQRHHLVEEFSSRFGEWMREHHPASADTVHLSNAYGNSGTAPAWNDLVLKTEEETLAWLNKFADAMDPQR